MPCASPTCRPAEAGARGEQTPRGPETEPSDSTACQHAVTLAALLSGLRPAKQLERSEVLIYQDDDDFGQVREREKARRPGCSPSRGRAGSRGQQRRAPSQRAKPSAVTALRPGEVAAATGRICCQMLPSQEQLHEAEHAAP